jgi:hypothetical protein
MAGRGRNFCDGKSVKSPEIVASDQRRRLLQFSTYSNGTARIHCRSLEGRARVVVLALVEGISGIRKCGKSLFTVAVQQSRRRGVQRTLKGIPMLQFVGVMLVLNALAVSVFFAVHKELGLKSGAVCLVAVLAGFVLFFNERATEITMTGVGTIKAVTTKAINDAKAIEQLRIDLDAQQKETTDRLKQVTHTLADAVSTNRRLEERAEFLSLMTGAISGNRKDYERLVAMSRDTSSKFQVEASQVVATAGILHTYNPLGPKYSIDFNPGVDIAKVSIADFTATYPVVRRFQRPAVIESLGNRKDLPLRERMEFLLKIIQTDEDLPAVMTAVYFFAQAAKIPSTTTDFHLCSEWWETNKDTIK